MVPYGYQQPYQQGYVNNYVPNYSPYSYAQNYNQYANQQNQQNIQQSNEVLQGTFVDSLDVVKAKNCALDGSPTYYPKSDKTEIYCKQLNPQTGAGMILTYKLENPSNTSQMSIENQVATLLSNFKVEISNEIAEIKDLVQSSMNNATQKKESTGTRKGVSGNE